MLAFCRDGARPSVIDVQSQFSFTLLASLRDRHFLQHIRNWKAVVVLSPQGSADGDLHMICGPPLGTGIRAPWHGLALPSLKKKGMFTTHTTASP